MLLVLAAAPGTLGVLACSNVPAPPSFLAARPECPHAWIWPADSSLNHGGLHNALTGNVDLVQTIINVPEFHDCQRFIVRVGAKTEYREFYAIWASTRLSQLTADLVDATASRGDTIGLAAPAISNPARPVAPGPDAAPPPDDSPFAVAVAEIYAEGQYAPLGIEPWLNCLYVFRRNQQWQARMVSAGNSNVQCERIPPNAAIPAGKDLEVIATSFPEFKLESDYPPVARWDWDATNGEQYIGIKCGGAWCEIGDRGLVPSAQLPVAGTAPRAERRVKLIKGWYDQQHLADDRANDLAPSGITGTIIPDTLLGHFNQPGDFARFVHAADVILTKSGTADDPVLVRYGAKFNFGESTVDIPNKVFLCAGAGCTPMVNETAPACAPGNVWSARIVKAATGPGTSVLKCITRMEASDYFVGPVGAPAPVILVPGTTRWRWLRDDEGGWMRCMQGCCRMGLG